MKKVLTLPLDADVITRADRLAIDGDASRSQILRKAIALGLRTLEVRRIATGEVDLASA
jgi:predicted transcriptional regulator